MAENSNVVAFVGTETQSPPLPAALVSRWKVPLTRAVRSPILLDGEASKICR